MRPDVKVTMPVQSKVQEELLLLLARHARVPSTTQVYEELADVLRLNSKQLSLRREDGRLHWPNLVQYAVERLKDDGYLVPTAKAGTGTWLLTDRDAQRPPSFNGFGRDFQGALICASRTLYEEALLADG
jgi:hypothetical protein